jgi:hypothetical protein
MFSPSLRYRRPKCSTSIGPTLQTANLAMKHNPNEAQIWQYFRSLVDKNGPLPDPATGVKSKCWLWLGSVTDRRYDRIKIWR